MLEKGIIMNQTGLVCSEGHHYTAKSPIGRHETACPFCLVENMEKELKTLKRWLRETHQKYRDEKK